MLFSFQYLPFPIRCILIALHQDSQFVAPTPPRSLLCVQTYTVHSPRSPISKSEFRVRYKCIQQGLLAQLSPTTATQHHPHPPPGPFLYALPTPCYITGCLPLLSSASFLFGCGHHLLELAGPFFQDRELLYTRPLSIKEQTLPW